MLLTGQSSADRTLDPHSPRGSEEAVSFGSGSTEFFLAVSVQSCSVLCGLCLDPGDLCVLADPEHDLSFCSRTLTPARF